MSDHTKLTLGFLIIILAAFIIFFGLAYTMNQPAAPVNTIINLQDEVRLYRATDLENHRTCYMSVTDHSSDLWCSEHDQRLHINAK